MRRRVLGLRRLGLGRLRGLGRGGGGRRRPRDLPFLPDNPTFLLIDDQFDLGYADILGALLFGDNIGTVLTAADIRGKGALLAVKDYRGQPVGYATVFLNGVTPRVADVEGRVVVRVGGVKEPDQDVGVEDDHSGHSARRVARASRG